MTSTAVGRIRWATLLPAWLAVAALLASPGIAQEAVRFAVIGDSGEVTPGLRRVAGQLQVYRQERAEFDFVLMLGDNVYSDGVGRGIQKVFEAVLGNHDIRRDRSTLQPAQSPNGHQVQYVTSGASARLRADVIDHGNTFTAKAVGTIHSFLIACATREAIALEAIGADGKTLDSFTVVKRQSTEPGRTGR
jgi:hypothetical protein